MSVSSRYHHIKWHITPIQSPTSLSSMPFNTNNGRKWKPIIVKESYQPGRGPASGCIEASSFFLASELWCKRCVEAVARYSSWLALDSLSVGSSHYYKMPSIIPPNININLLFRDENVRQIRSFLCKSWHSVSLSRSDTKSLGNSLPSRRCIFNNNLWHWHVDHSSRRK